MFLVSQSSDKPLASGLASPRVLGEGGEVVAGLVGDPLPGQEGTQRAAAPVAIHSCPVPLPPPQVPLELEARKEKGWRSVSWCPSLPTLLPSVPGLLPRAVPLPGPGTARCSVELYFQRLRGMSCV